MIKFTGETPPHLAVVGLGLRPGHLTHEARELIEAADIVLMLAAGPMAEAMVNVLAREVAVLNRYYEEGLDRLVTYSRMVEHIIGELRQDRLATLAIYGHPGVYCMPAHAAIQRAKELGFSARMYPAVSAEDALFADLGIDPAGRGCQSYEATHFLLHDKLIDPTSWLIVWQIGVVGEQGWSEQFSSPGLSLLQEKLVGTYNEAHHATIYFAQEALPDSPLTMAVRLGDLRETTFPPLSTLVVPPVGPDRFDPEMVRALNWSRDSTTSSVE